MILQHIARDGAPQRVIVPRRSFLKGLLGLLAAPAVVRDVADASQGLGQPRGVDRPRRTGPVATRSGLEHYAVLPDSQERRPLRMERVRLAHCQS
jgi:hypothetical protein